MKITPEMEFRDAARKFYELKSFGAGETHAEGEALDVGPVPVRRAVQRGQYVRRNTLKAYLRQTAALELFFGGMRLKDIDWANMREYQMARVAGAAPFVRFRRPQDAKPRKLAGGVVLPPRGPTPCPAKPQQVNQELDFLKRLKRMAGCWTDDDRQWHQSLQEEESDVPRALTPDEQTQWLELARSRRRWWGVYLYSLVAFDSCCSPGELRLLQLGNVRLEHGILKIPWPAAKNPYRHREIAIESAETLWALNELMLRARVRGAGDRATRPADYLFPLRDRKTRRYDPTRPMSSSGFKRAWNEVREECARLYPDAMGFRNFRQEDTRHTGATRLAEAGIGADIIAARMGHCNTTMRLHYTHIFVDAQRNALRKRVRGVNHFDTRAASYPQRREFSA